MLHKTSLYPTQNPTFPTFAPKIGSIGPITMISNVRFGVLNPTSCWVQPDIGYRT